jgi:hypothetical protein
MHVLRMSVDFMGSGQPDLIIHLFVLVLEGLNCYTMPAQAMWIAQCLWVRKIGGEVHYTLCQNYLAQPIEGNHSRASSLSDNITDLLLKTTTSTRIVISMHILFSRFEQKSWMV